MSTRRTLLPPLLLVLSGCTSPAPACKASSCDPPAAAPEWPTDTGLPSTDTDETTPQDSAAPQDTAEPAAEPGDTPETARHLPTPEPALQTSDAIDPPGDIDWYAVELTAGDLLWISVLAELRTPSSPLSPVLQVRAPDDRTQTVRGMALDIGGDNAALAYEVRSTGQHLIRVTAANPDTASSETDPTIGSAAHAYSLRLEQTAPFELEPHNNAEESMSEWLAQDGTYAFFGDPFVAGYPLFSGRIEHPDDVDLLPWSVRGEHSDGSPADWELWSWSPWPGSDASQSWTVTIHQPDGLATELGGITAPHTDPLWRHARAGLPLLPDVGLLVGTPPGELWLELSHSDTSTAGVYTGALAGWYTDAIQREADLPVDAAGERQPSAQYAEEATVVAVWGQLEDHELEDVYRIVVEPDRPFVHAFIQAAGIGSSLDPVLTLEGESGVLAQAASSPIDAGDDPDLVDIDTSGHSTVQLRVDAEGITGGVYLLQLHATASPRFP